MKDDLISRQAAIDALGEEPYVWTEDDEFARGMRYQWKSDHDAIEALPSVQSERCEYYELCRHGRDENKLRSVLGRCDYCNEDSDGYVKPLEKNGHAFVRFGMFGWELSLKANGWQGSAKIRYCPMCGRDLFVKRGIEAYSKVQVDNVPTITPERKPEPCSGCGYLGESCVGEGCGKLTERKDGEADD